LAGVAAGWRRWWLARRRPTGRGPDPSASGTPRAPECAAFASTGAREAQLQELARSRRCDGIICGHLHSPEDKQLGQLHYLNTGDWVTSLSAVVEHHDGTLEVVRYPEFMAREAPAGGLQGGLAQAPGLATR
jgi:hypothetical protein